MVEDTSLKYHTAIIEKSILIKAPKDKVWKKISNITNLPTWAIDVKETILKTKKRRGVGAIRDVIFNDGTAIEEHIVAWKENEYFTYIATDGLPLRAYVATISAKPNNKMIKITWKSYVNSKKMSSSEFKEFVDNMKTFYHDSLENFKKMLEKN
jgi:uncharacterized membrane protein